MKKYINTPASFLEKYAYLEYNYLGEKQLCKKDMNYKSPSI